jgi:hypothetical protein
MYKAILPTLAGVGLGSWLLLRGRLQGSGQRVLPMRTLQISSTQCMPKVAAGVTPAAALGGSPRRPRLA